MSVESSVVVESITIKVTAGLTFETPGPGCGVCLTKTVRSGARTGKSMSLILSAREFRALHRAMAVAEPFIINAEDLEAAKKERGSD